MEENKKFHTKKSLGQHFLTSDVVPTWMVDAGEVNEGDLVLEVGPGTGVLTREILSRGARVVAIEADERAVLSLQETFQTEIKEGDLVVIHGDIREMNLEDLRSYGIEEHEYTVVANIPYYLSGLLFRTFLAGSMQPQLLVFLVQKEVAKRACATKAKGEKESLLSLSIQAFGEATYVRGVSRGHFNPQPEVDSAIIKVRNIRRDRFIHTDPTIFFNILHLGFGKKRKQLLGNLSAKYPREGLVQIFSTVGVPLTVRAEDVDIDTWSRLVDVLSSMPTK